MAQNTTISIPAATWTQLTDADVAYITFQNVGSNHIIVKGTVDGTAPTSTDGGFRYNPGQGEKGVAIIELFPGVVGADRLWAYSADASSVVVSHA
jgi:hypothetical protein